GRVSSPRLLRGAPIPRGSTPRGCIPRPGDSGIAAGCEVVGWAARAYASPRALLGLCRRPPSGWGIRVSGFYHLIPYGPVGPAPRAGATPRPLPCDLRPAAVGGCRPSAERLRSSRASASPSTSVGPGLPRTAVRGAAVSGKTLAPLPLVALHSAWGIT